MVFSTCMACIKVFFLCVPFYVTTALNNGCMDGEDLIYPESVLRALYSHGWVIPSEQQVVT